MELEEKERKHFEERKQQGDSTDASNASTQAQLEDKPHSKRGRDSTDHGGTGDLKPEEYEQLNKFDDRDADFGEGSQEEDSSRFVSF